MEPYTVAGLAKIEGEAIDCDPSDLDGSGSRNYVLRGMVVHSGQASGGHYYSYIHCKDRGWFKFDDGDVTEAKMDGDEELKAQCYGGEYMSEVLGISKNCFLSEKYAFVHFEGVRPHAQAHVLPEAEALVERLHAVLHPRRPGGGRQHLARLGGCAAGQAQAHERGERQEGDCDESGGPGVRSGPVGRPSGGGRRRGSLHGRAAHPAPDREEHPEAERQLPSPAKPVQPGVLSVHEEHHKLQRQLHYPAAAAGGRGEAGRRGGGGQPAGRRSDQYGDRPPGVKVPLQHRL